MSILSKRNTAVNIAAANSKVNIGVQRPLNVTTVIALTDEYKFTSYNSGQSMQYRISRKKQSGKQNQDILVGSDKIFAEKKWQELLTTGRLTRL
jgi:hypothetical protein